jgi:hypothetical protein
MTRRSRAAKALVEQPGLACRGHTLRRVPGVSPVIPNAQQEGPALRIVLFPIGTRLAPLAGARANRSLELQSRSLSITQRYAVRAIPR